MCWLDSVLRADKTTGVSGVAKRGSACNWSGKACDSKRVVRVLERSRNHGLSESKDIFKSSASV